MANRMRCPYRFCEASVLLVGKEQSVVRKHPYEGYGDCPGSGYNNRKPAMEQDRLMAEREKALLDPNKDGK